MDSRLKPCGNDIRSEEAALERFRLDNLDLFKKDDRQLFTHLLAVLSFLFIGTAFGVLVPFWPAKIILGIANAFLWFSLINVTLHHHHTHHNAASGGEMKKVLNFIYRIALPNAPKRLNRYTRAHLNHHARPFDETDVDHHYGTRQWLAMRQKAWRGMILYFLELTFIGAYVPGWEDDHYMNTVPLEKWNRQDYEAVKDKEKIAALKTAAIQWGLFLIALKFLPAIAWGWALPMLLVKNWAHFLGQFQHYDRRFLDPALSINQRTKTYPFPGFLNYLCGGEISGHFLHHLYPEMPYYHVEEARKRFAADPELAGMFLGKAMSLRGTRR